MLPAPAAVFVCEGNTCRSPLAEVIARRDLGGDGSRFSSAGLSARSGAGATPEAMAAAAALGLDLAEHHATPVAAATWPAGCWVITMTRGQAVLLRTRGLVPAGCRLGILGAPGVDLSGVGPSPQCEEVGDPWGEDQDAYHRTAAQIRRLLQGWAPVLGNVDGAGGSER